MPIIRKVNRTDLSAIREIHARAFGRENEARLVEALHAGANATLSLMAETNRKAVGHILFSPATVENCSAKLLGLAPLAVIPEYQHRGFGSMLVRAGLAAARTMGIDGILVLGDPGFYHRFGFLPTGRFNIQPPWKDIPAEAFMAVELKPNGLDSINGTAHYAPQFDLFS